MVTKVEEAQVLLDALGMPEAQQNVRSAHVLLVMLNLKEDSKWAEASNDSLRIVDIMDRMNTLFGINYKPNTRETIRKHTLHQFVLGALVVENDGKPVPTNSPKYAYRITTDVLKVIKSFGTEKWPDNILHWKEHHETLIEKYSQERKLTKVPVIINDKSYTLSYGKHNKLQKAIIEEFAPAFAPGAEVLYVGDTTNKNLYKDIKRLRDLGIEITDNDKLPDVVLYVKEKDWLYFVEAVTSSGPMDHKRILELEEITEKNKSGIIYVTAFLDRSSRNGFKKHIHEIAWETEVWIAENPNHLIHLNGDRFLGPR